MTDPTRLYPTCLILPGAGSEEPVELSPSDAWQRLYGRYRDNALGRRIWQHAIRLAQQEISGATDPTGYPVSGWRLVLLSLAVPRLRSTVRRLGWEFGLARDELESAAVLGLLTQLPEVDPEQQGAEGLLIRSAVRHCWALVTPRRSERPVADISTVVDARQSCPDPAEELAWELSVTPPDRPDGLAATLYFTASRANVEGVRLGALAERLGLREVVHRARRPGPGPRVGKLALQPSQTQR
ncbi:hypothetical protein AB0O82_35125 [Kitasatospora sp. NPDC088264]|uniref:hypothetical protein n=1 Tax=Kitasatospora sp. NPDC088264 TaxID=3155296 RepID=UPI0034368621